MQEMLEQRVFIRWSEDWYNGYAMFAIYPPLIYVFAAALNTAINNVAVIMKMLIIGSFSSQPLLLYSLGKVLGRTRKGSTVLAALFSLTPLNVFFLFNNYFILIISQAMLLIFLIEFFKYDKNRDKASFLISTAMLTVISLTYHRTLYYIFFLMLFYILINVYRKQIKKVASTIIMSGIGVGISSFWLIPALLDMLNLDSAELYQSLILVAEHNGFSFQNLAIFFIVPFLYLVFKRIKVEKITDDHELTLLLSLIFFSILCLGPYGLLYYFVPFSSSQRIEVTLLMATFLAIILASKLFDNKIIDGRRTLYGITFSSLITLTMIVGVFFHPQMALSLEIINFSYNRGDVNDSLTNLIDNAYVKQQIFLGKSDEDFLSVLNYIAYDPREGSVVFYSNRSQTVDMFYYYALLPLSGKPTPQGISPEGEGDLKWNTFTRHVIWQANETLLKVAGTRWIISNYPIVLEGNYTHKIFGKYVLYELYNVRNIIGSEGKISKSIGEIKVVLNSECSRFIISESYHPRWRAFDQNNNELQISSTDYGFMEIVSPDNIKVVYLIYSNTMADFISKIISGGCLICYVILVFVRKPFKDKKLFS